MYRSRCWGCEAAVHAMEQIFADNNTEAMILVDASNAFNCLNRQVTLLNCESICPALTHILTNTYRNNSHLFVDGQCILSKEGTTQGDPLAMAIYAIGTQPSIHKLGGIAKQVWYADDSAAGSRLEKLRKWWDLLVEIGPQYGYFPNSSKTHVLAKPQYVETAKEIFKDTSIVISTKGERYLGETELPRGVDFDREAVVAIKRRHRTTLKAKADDLQSRLPEPQRRAVELAREKGDSSTLTTIPISEHGFFFEVKSDFHDYVHLRYCWPLANLPPTCPCGSRFTVDHAQICKLSGFIHMRHDDPTRFLAKCMKEVHNDVELEPSLQPLTGETLHHQTANTEPDARADIRVHARFLDRWT